MTRRRQGTLRPKWHLHDGAVDVQWVTNDFGMPIYVRTAKKKYIGSHMDAHYAPHESSVCAARQERHAVRQALRRHDASNDLEFEPRPGMVSEANWRGS
jgi:hypothetical protein